jgi:hypothetical protein
MQMGSFQGPDTSLKSYDLIPLDKVLQMQERERKLAAADYDINEVTIG